MNHPPIIGLSFYHIHLLFLILFSLTYYVHISAPQQISIQSLPLGSILQFNQSLTSPNHTFALHFFSLTPHRNYLGIAFNGVRSNTRPIWVANRNVPAMDGAVLHFRSDGNLVIFNPNSSTHVWMSGTAGMSITSMLLHESGNLILTDESGAVIWQSFEHPTDTWSSGMKRYVGFPLFAFKSTVDPAEGRYSVSVLKTSAEVLAWNQSIVYWTSGVWTGQTYADIPESLGNPFFNFNFVDDSSRPYTMYTEKRQLFSHFTLDYDGVVRVRMWDGQSSQWIIPAEEPKFPCQVYHLCGQNGVCNSDLLSFCSCPSGFKPVDLTGWSMGDWSLGCESSITLSCNSSGFSILPNTSYDQGVGASLSDRYYMGRDQRWCQDICTNDCACLGFSWDAQTSNCSLHHGPFFNGMTSQGLSQTFFLRVNSLALSPSNEFLLPIGDGKKTRKTRLAWITGLVVIIGCASLSSVAFLVRWRLMYARRLKEIYFSEFLLAFSYKELRAATRNFSEEIGAGAFGTVYKGFLPDHSTVAVKKLHRPDRGDRNFRTEVSTLGLIQHVNLVRLRGFCAQGTHRLLVYDFMPNGSLDNILFTKPGAETSKAVLDWDTRHALALGTARGILYLHEECRNRIIHCDIKPENILLDADLSAKVADFGLAKMMGREFSRVMTTMRGTRGYLAPEWISGQPITAKADVYSYGMTLLEIISGRRNLGLNYASLDEWYFPLWACKQARHGNFSSLADARLCGNFKEEEVRKAVLVGIWCIQEEEGKRPSMAEVVRMLEGTLEINNPPIPHFVASMGMSEEQ